jgi:hypothetical protein
LRQSTGDERVNERASNFILLADAVGVRFRDLTITPEGGDLGVRILTSPAAG